MSLSLLDLLSCSLAVVVILLVIALNTGQGSNDANAQTIVVEILVYGSNDVTDEPLELSWGSITEELYVENTGLGYKLRSDLGLLDSLGITASMIPNMQIPDTIIEGVTYKQCLLMSFDMLPSAKGANISATVLSNLYDPKTQVICRMANAQSKRGYTKQESIYPVSYPFDLNLSCSSSDAKLTIEKDGSTISTVHLTKK